MNVERDQVTELQVECTKLLNENRLLRAQQQALKEILQHMFIEIPMLARLQGLSAPDVEVVRQQHTLQKIFERIEMLEKDAWTQPSAAVRKFIETGEDLMNFSSEEFTKRAREFIGAWVEEFQKLV